MTLNRAILPRSIWESREDCRGCDRRVLFGLKCGFMQSLGHVVRGGRGSWGGEGGIKGRTYLLYADTYKY